MRSVPVLLALLVAALPPPVSAQGDSAAGDSRDEEARGLFVAGRAAFDDGRYEEALDYFRRSYELSDRPELLYNIGQAASALGKDEETLWAFEKYLQQVPDASNRDEVQARVIQLRKAQQAPGPEEEAEEEVEEQEEKSQQQGRDGVALECGAHVALVYITSETPELDLGLGGQGRFGLAFTPNWVAELSAGFSLNPKTEMEGGPVLDLSVRGGGRYVFAEMDPVMPFIGTALALHRWSTSRTSAADGSMIGVADVNLGIDLFAGARLGISNSFSAEAALRMGFIFAHSVFNDRSATSFSLLAGFAYHI